MGKLEEEESAVQVADSSARGPCIRRILACAFLLPVLLGVYVLVLSVWSFRARGEDGPSVIAPYSEQSLPHIEASFKLNKSVSTINASISQLQLDLQNEIGIPDSQIHVLSIVSIPYTNWTVIHFAVSPDASNDAIAPAELSLLKDTFVELFMQRSANLSLTTDLFGKVSDFEVLSFPGGITVVPQQPGFPLSKVLVLFNFTLHNSLSNITSNFVEFRYQLANGIILKPNENLFVQLTNLDGSTLKSPLIVQTSILPVVGALLPAMRLKQLAREILSSPKRNLGLNHTLFGRVKKIELSSYLAYTLGSDQSPSPSPSPSSGPAPSPMDFWESGPCSSPKPGFSSAGYGRTPSYPPQVGLHGPEAAPRKKHHDHCYRNGLTPRSSVSPPPSSECYAASPTSPSPHSKSVPYPSPSPSPTLGFSSPSPSPFSNRHDSDYWKAQSPSRSFSQSVPSTSPVDVHFPRAPVNAEAPNLFADPEPFVPSPEYGPSSCASTMGIQIWISFGMLLLMVGI